MNTFFRTLSRIPRCLLWSLAPLAIAAVLTSLMDAHFGGSYGATAHHAVAKVAADDGSSSAGADTGSSRKVAE